MNPVQSVRNSEDRPCCFRSIRGGGIRVIWELISKCNMDCMHCFVEHTEYGIPTRQALSVIREFPRIPVTKVMFTGGEPFLRKDLFRLVEACLAQKVLVDVTTNLTLVNRDKILRLRDIGLQEITTSLDGPEAVHDYIRRKKGSFRQVTEAIQEVREAGIAVDVVCVAQRANADFLGETIDIAYRLGVSSITISGLKSLGDPRPKAREVCLRPDQFDRVQTQIHLARDRYRERIPIRTVSLLERLSRPLACPVDDLVAINAKGLVSNCLLAPVPSPLICDLTRGLKWAWGHLNRRYCCF